MSELWPFLISGVGTGSVYALSGVGLVVLYRSSGVLNFAFGALGAVAAYVAWTVLDFNGPLLLAWLAGTSTAMLISLAYGRWIAPHLSERDSVIRSIGTLGLALMLMGLTEWLWGESPRRLALPTDNDALELGDVRLTYTRVMTLTLAVVMMSAVGLLLTKTRMGLKMRALANDRRLAAMLGISTLQVDTTVWLLSGAFAGVCGIFLGNLVRLQATVLTFMVIPAFAAAILGRLHSLPATVAAGVAIGVLEALAILVPELAPFRSATPFVVALLAILFFQPQLRKA
jgi:branched-chain amino acid transport system permease protein